jgi:hypothetical protein
LSTSEVLGVPPAAWKTDLDYSGDISTSPAKLWYFLLTIQNIYDTTAGVVAYQMQVTFNVEFFQRRLFD